MSITESFTEMIYNGDCLDILPELDANSVDAVVTDPPYGLGFMGKDWDHGIPGTHFWTATLRVMKPGAFLLSFGGTRTFHRLTCAIEDAGFEIRDCMMWLYGSGFPKSHDVSKAIDKAAGAERKAIGPNPNGRPNCVGTERNVWSERVDAPLSIPSTDAAREWSGWGTALKPAWEPIIVARKPLEGTVAENVQKWGTGGMNIDGGRIPTNPDVDDPRLGGKGQWNIKREASEHTVSLPPATMGSSALGRWPANVILDEEAGAMLDGQSGERGGCGKASGPTLTGESRSHSRGLFSGVGSTPFYGDTGGASRFFYCAKASKRERNAGLEGMPKQSAGAYGEFAGDGRGRQTEHQPAANNHPTVKPVSLLTYLAKLVCPPGGVILDPFMGSGSMGVAAQNLGFDFIGIEKEKSYCDISNKRMSLLNEFDYASNS